MLRAFSSVHDEFLPSQTRALTSEDQTPLGRPVLPLLTYDITLQADRTKASGEIPVPRGVRLLSVETLDTVDGFDPHITSAVSDVIKVAPQEPPLTEQGLWSPGVPFASAGRFELNTISRPSAATFGMRSSNGVLSSLTGSGAPNLPSRPRRLR